MGETWITQNKNLPGVYVNFLSNKPLAITLEDRGIVSLPLKLNVGTKGDIYKVTAISSEIEDENLELSKEEYLPIKEALKNASLVLVYNLGTTPTTEDIDNYLSSMLTQHFNTIGYIYTDNTDKIVTWVKSIRTNEGKSIQVVMSGVSGDDEAIINVGNGVIINDGSVLSAAQCCAFVAGATAGAKINQSLTNFKYFGAIDVNPRLTKTEQETAVNKGEFIFKSNFNQTVTCLYDINSLTTFTAEKSKDFRKNRVVRVLDNINNDITEIFEANYMGKVDNNEDGRGLVRASIIEYMNELQRLKAIKNFIPDDVEVLIGKDIDSVVINCFIQPVDSIEKFYITVNIK